MPYRDREDHNAAQRRLDWIRKGYRIAGERVVDTNGNEVARWTEPANLAGRFAAWCRDWVRKGYQIDGERVIDGDGNEVARWAAPKRLTAPLAPPPEHDYIVGESGHTLKGVSIRTNAEGTEDQRWTKTSRAGRDDADVQHIPDPKLITKIATLYDQDGRVSQQWIAERPSDVDKELLWQAIADKLIDRVGNAPALAPLAPPARLLNANALALYPVGDHHFGMLSWSKETGASYDLDIAQELLARATDELIVRVPPCAQALIAVLGDFFHYDSFEAVTPTSRNKLDADGRYPKMVDVVLDSLPRMIERAAEHHGSVHVIIEIGNHDLANSVFLARALARIYRDNPRITIDTSPRHFHYYEFGNVLLATHHGHGVPMAQLPLIMAHDQPEAWGRTRYRHWLTGHIHSSKTQAAISSQDYSGVTVESFRILAAADAWAVNKGYRSIRDMKAIVYDRDFGETERITVKPEQWANDNERERMAA